MPFHRTNVLIGRQLRRVGSKTGLPNASDDPVRYRMLTWDTSVLEVSQEGLLELSALAVLAEGEAEGCSLEGVGVGVSSECGSGS